MIASCTTRIHGSMDRIHENNSFPRDYCAIIARLLPREYQQVKPYIDNECLTSD